MELPEEVRRTKERLEEELDHKLHVAFIKNSYYVYEEKGVREQGKTRVLTLYIGKILQNGEFRQAKHRKKEYENIASVEELEKGRQEANPVEELIHPDIIDLSILEAISTNARMSTNEIAKRINVSPSFVRYRLERLEKRYAIKYTLEIALAPFGYLRYVALVKFTEGMPKIDDMKKVLEAEPKIQLAALLKGEYDLLIYIIAESTRELDDCLYAIRSSRTFAPYKSYWYVSYITYAYGFIPLRNEFLEKLGKKVWHRTKETPRRPPNSLTEREYLVLKALNENAKEDFTKIDEKLTNKIQRTVFVPANGLSSIQHSQKGVFDAYDKTA